MTDSPEDDDTIVEVMKPAEPENADPSVVKPVTDLDDNEDAIVDEDQDELVSAIDDTPADLPTQTPAEAVFDDDLIEFRGESAESIDTLLHDMEKERGPQGLDTEVRTTGSWANLLFRMRTDPSFEEQRIRDALGKMSAEDRDALSAVYRDKEKGVVLKTSPILKKAPAGEIRSLSGDEAMMAFVCQTKGGGYRVPLFNSGLTIDILAPTGNDLQMMLTNCSILDRDLGSSLGAQYFTYNDVMYKTQILNFLQPLIVGSSYMDWRKKDKLWAAIKLPDLTAIVATLAAIAYPEGYDNFVVTCKRPVTPEQPKLCAHEEKITADIFKMILTRWSALSESAIAHMTAARHGNAKHTAAQIAKYQSDLGLEGEKLTFGDVTFTLRVPSLSEHVIEGTRFISDIINEVEGDNSQGREEQMGVRVVRTFVPWVAEVEKLNPEDGSGARTSEPKVITRMLEVIDDADQEGKIREAFADYIGRTQLTYVGYPVVPCPACGHAPETPSGMWTIDPFQTFFTLAFRYLKPNDSSKTNTASSTT